MHVIGTAGHVDHGKSTLVERLTGIDPDRFAEEKRRGLTIDLGFAWLKLPSGAEIGLIDVPGHERFIKNMLSGAGGVSVCLFVVAANEGWMPQSAEHLAILDVLGVASGVVALTKSDIVDADTLEYARAEVEEKLTVSSLAGAPVVGCSAVTGDGIETLLDALAEAIESAPPAPDLGRARLWIDRVFTIAGSGTVVTGTLMGGRLEAGAEVEVAPSGRRARVRTIQSHKKSVEEIGPGHRVALNLVGLERGDAERGDAVVVPHAWRPTNRVDAAVRVSPTSIAGREHKLTEKGAHLLYVGSAETPVRIKLLGRDEIGPGEEGVAQLYLRDPLPVAPGDRFVLRDAGRVLTFGGGVILDPLPRVAKRTDRARVETLEKLREADPKERLRILVDAEGELALEEALLRSDASGLPEETIRLGPQIVSSLRMRELTEQVAVLLQAHHAEHPLDAAMPRESLRAELRMDAAVFDELVARLESVVEEGAGVRLEGHRVGLTEEQQRVRDRVMQRIEEAGFQPPLAADLSVDADLLRALTAAGELVKIDGFYLTAAQAAEARAKIRQRIEQEGPVTVAEIRDLLGTTRKYAVPLCEWLDTTGATRRRGDERVLGPNP